MALYIPSLEAVQLGLEAAWGDLAAPTVPLVGISECKINPKVESMQLPDKRATTMPAYIAVVTKLWAEGNLSGAVNYEQFVHLLDAMFGINAGSPYDYLAELVPTTALRSFNLVYGQDDVTYSMGGAIMDSLGLTFAKNGVINFAAHLKGKAVVPDALEVLAYPEVVIAMGNHVQVYLDPIAGPVGTTEIPTTGFSGQVNITCDRELVWHLGSLAPDSVRHGKWGGSTKLVMEMTSDTQDVLDAVLGQTVSPGGYVARIKATDALGTSILTLDAAGHILGSPILFTDAEGVTTVELDFTPVFTDDATFLSCWKASLVLP